MAAVSPAQRFALDGLVIFQVFDGHPRLTVLGRAPHAILDQLRGLALVKFARPLFDHSLEDRRQFRLFENLSGLIRSAVPQEDPLRFGIPRKLFARAFQAAFQLMPDREAVGREFARRLGDLGPFHRAVFFQRVSEASHRARDSGGHVAVSRGLVDVFAFFVKIDVAMGRGGRHLAIINRRRLAVGLPDDHKSAAAQIPRRRPNHRQRQPYRHRGVNRIAAALQRVDADLRRDLADRRNHSELPADRRTRSGIS